MTIPINGLTVAHEEHATHLVVHHLAMACVLMQAVGKDGGQLLNEVLRKTFTAPEAEGWLNSCSAFVDVFQTHVEGTELYGEGDIEDDKGEDWADDVPGTAPEQK